MLRAIVLLLEKHGSLSLREIAAVLGSQPGAVEPMLELLVKKGLLEEVSTGCPRGACSGCSCSSREDALIFRSACTGAQGAMGPC